MNNRVAIVDASNILHRAYHSALAFDKEAGADKVINMARSMVIKYLRELAIDSKYLLIVSESGATWRNELYPEYKVGRKEKTPVLIEVLERGPEALTEIGGKNVNIPGHEADDVIATYCRLLEDAFYFVEVISGDKDLLQCITDAVSVCSLKQGGWDRFTPASFRRKYNFAPELMADYKALVGDKSDNINGVYRIGDKAASQLVGVYGAIRQIYEIVDTPQEGVGVWFTPRIMSLLRDGREIAYRNILLTQLKRDVPGVSLKG